MEFLLISDLQVLNKYQQSYNNVSPTESMLFDMKGPCHLESR